MRNKYLPHHRFEESEKSLLDGMSATLAVVMLVVLIGLVCHSCVDAVVKTVEAEEEISRKKVWTVEQTYIRPAAYRLAAPDQDQMDHLHALLMVMEVRQ